MNSVSLCVYTNLGIREELYLTTSHLSQEVSSSQMYIAFHKNPFIQRAYTKIFTHFVSSYIKTSAVLPAEGVPSCVGTNHPFSFA
jgi:hypothetical protein